MQRGTNGFWRGVFAGLVLVIAAALALAWSFPPLQPPEVDEGMQVPPAPPAAAASSRSTSEAAAGTMLTPAPGPLVEGVGTAPGIPAAPAADTPAGSPSLVPAE